LQDLPEDLEWKIIYVGSAESEEFDQVLKLMCQLALWIWNDFLSGPGSNISNSSESGTGPCEIRPIRKMRGDIFRLNTSSDGDFKKLLFRSLWYGINDDYGHFEVKLMCLKSRIWTHN
jgi:hypothetical protein